MALLKFALLLSIGFQGCALASNLNTEVFLNVLNVPQETRTGNVCQDCTQIFELLADMLSNPDLQKKIMTGIESLCDYMPGATSKLCKEEVEKMLPLAINLITGLIKPAEVCKMIGLCGSCDQQEKILRYLVAKALQDTVTSENQVQPTSQCSFCLFLVKTLESLLPKERTEGAVTKLLEEICHILPSTYKDQCEAIIEKFSKIVLDALLQYATPQNICSLIHLCNGQEAPVVDPCTLATYRCRDIKTAVKCGTMFYCHQYAWKPLNYNTL